MSKKTIISKTKNPITNENDQDFLEIKGELQILKKEYVKELELYKESSRDIIETEEKFNNLSKKINKIKYKQMALTIKIDNQYIYNLNNYNIDHNTKIIFLTLLGYPFPHQELFYFNSPDILISQLFFSKEYLFNLITSKKNEYDIIKSKYDDLNKDINILKPIYDYIKLNFDIVNLLQKREIIFMENKSYIQKKDISYINVNILKKKIKEKFDLIKRILKPNLNQNYKQKYNNNLTKKAKDFDEITNNSHLLSIKNFDEISGKSFILSLSNENSILELFKEEEINKFGDETKELNHIYYNNNSKALYLNEEYSTYSSNRLMNGIKTGRNINKYSKSPETNYNLATEKFNRKISNKILGNFRSPQHKKSKGKETLQIETPVGDSGCCTSCT